MLMIATPSMALASISGASEREFFGNFSDQFPDSDVGVA